MLGPRLRDPGHAPLRSWLTQGTSRLFLPTVCVAEITGGIAKLRRDGGKRKASALDAWLASLLHLYAARILPLDIAAARATGELADRARALGQAPGFADLAIAGIAEANGLIVLTRNIRHFTPIGVAAHDPFVARPG